MKTRCGGAHVDYVHSVYATCSSINETLEWLVHNNVIEHAGELGVAIPSCVAGLMDHTNGAAFFLPFQRRLHPGKAGRKPAVKELPASAVRAIGVMQKGVAASETPVVAAEKKVPFALDRLPNTDEVLAERYMSPFDFLPQITPC